jgi:flagellar assembly protein FliH
LPVDGEDESAGGDFVDPEMVIKMAEDEAQKIVAGANTEADLIIQKAKLHIEEERSAALETARREGFEQGSYEAKMDNEALLNQARQTVEDARTERNEIIASIEHDMVSLVAELTEKLIGASLIINPGVILNMIRAGIENIQASELTVRVSPDDFETANSLKENLTEMVDSDTVLNLVKDTSLNRGDCVIDTPIGSIDSSLDKQWQSLRDDLLIILNECYSR